MNVFKTLFGREFNYTHYKTGHKTRHRIGNIVVYIILFIGIGVMLAIPSFMAYKAISTNNYPLLWASIPCGLIAIGLSALMSYRVSKSQLPEE